MIIKTAAFFIAATALLSAQSAPSADVLKQVLSKKLIKLTPAGMTERQVMYQQVRPGTPTGASYPFFVTLQMRDYGAGYPRNRYYGQTCVSHFDNARFALFRSDSGEWDAEGALTPSLDAKQCKDNPSEGASSIPLSSLSGSPAPPGEPPLPGASSSGRQQQQSAPGGGGASSGALAAGRYECWANGQARLLLNFSVRSSSQYIGSDGQPGTYSYDAGSNRVTFRTGALNGVMPTGFYAVYYAPQGRPTVSFRSPSGNEASFCQLVR